MWFEETPYGWKWGKMFNQKNFGAVAELSVSHIQKSRIEVTYWDKREVIEDSSLKFNIRIIW